MYLKALISPDRVVLHLKGGNRREILEALVGTLEKDHILTDADAFIGDLEKREEEITTQVEAGVAFPHARSSAVRRLALVVGIADEPGLVFNPDVSEPCRIFFLIAVPSLAPTAHLPLLQKLANFAHNPKQTKKLLNCDSTTQAVRCLKSFKG